MAHNQFYASTSIALVFTLSLVWSVRAQSNDELFRAEYQRLSAEIQGGNQSDEIILRARESGNFGRSIEDIHDFWSAAFKNLSASGFASSGQDVEAAVLWQEVLCTSDEAFWITRSALSLIQLTSNQPEYDDLTVIVGEVALSRIDGLCQPLEVELITSLCSEAAFAYERMRLYPFAAAIRGKGEVILSRMDDSEIHRVSLLLDNAFMYERHADWAGAITSYDAVFTAYSEIVAIDRQSPVYLLHSLRAKHRMGMVTQAEFRAQLRTLVFDTQSSAFPVTAYVAIEYASLLQSRVDVPEFNRLVDLALSHAPAWIESAKALDASQPAVAEDVRILLNNLYHRAERRCTPEKREEIQALLDQFGWPAATQPSTP